MTGDAVLIPGTLCDARVFDPLLAWMPEVRGQVAELGAHASVEAAAEGCLATAPPRFVAIGFSLGGFVALEILRRAPELLRGVVLIAGNAHPDAPANAATRLAEVEAARSTGMDAFVAQRWSRWGSPDDVRTCEQVAAMAETLGHEAHARHAAMNIARPDFRALVRSSAVPILVIAGEDDALCPRERYEAAAQGPNANLRMVRGAGHYLLLEQPQAVAEAIATWEIAA